MNKTVKILTALLALSVPSALATGNADPLAQGATRVQPAQPGQGRGAAGAGNANNTTRTQAPQTQVAPANAECVPAGRQGGRGTAEPRGTLDPRSAAETRGARDGRGAQTAPVQGKATTDSSKDSTKAANPAECQPAQRGADQRGTGQRTTDQRGMGQRQPGQQGGQPGQPGQRGQGQRTQQSAPAPRQGAAQPQGQTGRTTTGRTAPANAGQLQQNVIARIDALLAKTTDAKAKAYLTDAKAQAQAGNLRAANALLLAAQAIINK